MDNEKRNDLITKLASFFKVRYDISLAFLMGSQASGRARSESDVDVAVLFYSHPSAEEILSLKGDLEDLVRNDIDLVLLNSSGPVIGIQALKTGILLLNRDCAYEIFFVKVLMEYDDLKYYRREIENNIMEGRIYA